MAHKKGRSSADRSPGLKVSRKQQKEETRQKLMDAASAELASGRSFDTLSLREVAKLAGIAPTSISSRSRLPPARMCACPHYQSS